MRKWLVLGLLAAAACAPPAGAPPAAPHEPAPYRTVTPSATAGPTGLVEFAQTPLPTPTPFDYAVKRGDTLGGIAERFNVPLDALLAANPGVSPNAMSIGATLKIPSTPRNLSGEGTPTPAPFAVQQIGCRPTGEGQLWCFALARNEAAEPLENVTAQITLLDAEGASRDSQTAMLPLDILPPYQSLPLTALFRAAGLPEVRPQVQVLSAIRLMADDPRYLPAALQNTQVQVDWSGLSAQARGQVWLPEDSKPAASVWVAAAAYDRDGSVVGVRRWESSGGLAAGETLPFALSVGSVGGAIQRVDFAVEARP